MFEMLIGGFLLTGSVCIVEGDGHRNCRDIPAAQFGSKYVCDKRVETILESFPHIKPEVLGFSEGQQLRVQLRCRPAQIAGI